MGEDTHYTLCFLEIVMKILMIDHNEDHLIFHSFLTFGEITA